MDWVRSQRRVWGWAALIALVLQLGLSFGHIHGIHTENAAVAAVHDAAAGTQPAVHDDDHESHYCAIYALGALLNGAQTAAAPAIAVPALLALALFAAEDDDVRVVSRHVAFRSRAPPTA